MWIWICDPCPNFTLFYLSSTGIDACLDTVQIAIASLKSKKSRLPHMISISFRNVERDKLVQVRYRCRNVWVVSGSFLFSGFNRFSHFMSSTTVYKCKLNKLLRVRTFLLPGPVAAGRSQAAGRLADGPDSHWMRFRWRGSWEWQSAAHPWQNYHLAFSKSAT